MASQDEIPILHYFDLGRLGRGEVVRCVISILHLLAHARNTSMGTLTDSNICKAFS